MVCGKIVIGRDIGILGEAPAGVPVVGRLLAGILAYERLVAKVHGGGRPSDPVST